MNEKEIAVRVQKIISKERRLELAREYQTGFDDGYKAGKHDGVIHAQWVEAWIDSEDEHKCSNCGAEAFYVEFEGEVLSPFCPQCGAKMDGGENVPIQ